MRDNKLSTEASRQYASAYDAHYMAKEIHKAKKRILLEIVG